MRRLLAPEGTAPGLVFLEHRELQWVDGGLEGVGWGVAFSLLSSPSRVGCTSVVGRRSTSGMAAGTLYHGDADSVCLGVPTDAHTEEASRAPHLSPRESSGQTSLLPLHLQ